MPYALQKFTWCLLSHCLGIHYCDSWVTSLQYLILVLFVYINIIIITLLLFYIFIIIIMSTVGIIICDIYFFFQWDLRWGLKWWCKTGEQRQLTRELWRGRGSVWGTVVWFSVVAGQDKRFLVLWPKDVKYGRKISLNLDVGVTASWGKHPAAQDETSFARPRWSGDILNVVFVPLE